MSVTSRNDIINSSKCRSVFHSHAHPNLLSKFDKTWFVSVSRLAVCCHKI